MSGTFVITTGRDHKLHFVLKGEAGETLLQGPGFGSRKGIDMAIAAVRAGAGNPASYQKTKTTSGEHYFVLKSHHDQVIGKSEMFRTELACDQVIRAAQGLAASAEVEDRTAAHA